jgi:hypothetical protein
MFLYSILLCHTFEAAIVYGSCIGMGIGKAPLVVQFPLPHRVGIPDLGRRQCVIFPLVTVIV